MQTPALSPVVDLAEPVKTLLAHKGNEIWSIPPEASVYEAIECMSEKEVGALLVLSRGYLAGIITERDYARKVILRGRQSHETAVRDIMSAPVLFVTPDNTVSECMLLITSRRIRYLPVINGNRVIGMLSIGDLVKWIIDAQDRTIRHLHDYIAGSNPG